LTHRLAVLSKEEGLGAKGRPERRAEHRLVRQLAELFQKTTGAKPARGTYDAYSETQHAGKFEQFATCVDKELRRQAVKALTSQKIVPEDGELRAMSRAEANSEAEKYVFGELGHIIRSVIEN
jgi:hypothetical protein